MATTSRTSDLNIRTALAAVDGLAHALQHARRTIEQSGVPTWRGFQYVGAHHETDLSDSFRACEDAIARMEERLLRLGYHTDQVTV